MHQDPLKYSIHFIISCCSYGQCCFADNILWVSSLIQKLNESDIIHETWVIFDTDSCEKSKHNCGVEGGVIVTFVFTFNAKVMGSIPWKYMEKSLLNT